MPSGSRVIFDNYRKSLKCAGLATTTFDHAICPLCWKEVIVQDLTVEHIVPDCVGGNEVILTCASCNSGAGAKLDLHLKQYQATKDFSVGQDMRRTKVTINGHKLAADLISTPGNRNFNIVKEANDPKVLEILQNQMKEGILPQEIKFQIALPAKDNFNRAAVRSAYLILFKCFGYEYAMHETVQSIRRRAVGDSTTEPDFRMMVVSFGEVIFPLDRQHFVVPVELDGIDVFFVVLRLSVTTSSYLGVFMPIPTTDIKMFFDVLSARAKQRSINIKLPFDKAFW
jgi:hypothetical protein